MTLLLEFDDFRKDVLTWVKNMLKAALIEMDALRVLRMSSCCKKKNHKTCLSFTFTPLNLNSMKLTLYYLDPVTS